MILIILVVTLTILKLIEYAPLVDFSWWWIFWLFIFTIAWFEFLEPFLGLNKQKSFDQYDKLRKERMRKNFKK